MNLNRTVIFSRFQKAGAVILLLLIDFYFITALFTYAEKYPFSRLIVDSTLHHSVDMFNSDKLYKGVIISINDKPVTSSPLATILNSENGVRKAVIQTEGTTHTLNFRSKQFNSDIFVFGFFLVLIAIIHLIW
jgi:hypothetical protein